MPTTFLKRLLGMATHLRFWFLAPLLVVCASCGETRPKTLDEMYEEERQLPSLFITAESGTHITAPGDTGVFVDESTGELAWRALTCTNPACPQFSADEPFLFIAPDPAIVANPDGSLGYDRSLVDEADNNFGNCPECLKIRNLASESDEDRQQYSNFATPYVLPKTALRREELAAERKAREAELHERMGRKAD